MDKTTLFDIKEIQSALVSETLEEVYEALLERGYNPINQIVGFLISGDPGYISSHKNAREKMSSLERSKVIEVLLKEYMHKK
ncbi:MAG: IreB family regulatory phosphoprotein [Mollicutes bacterium]|jgi:uncharacterized protein (UPF0297 family)|nr:IreB family regulatory phosphoprotein [Mollicutes bacterium]